MLKSVLGEVVLCSLWEAKLQCLRDALCWVSALALQQHGLKSSRYTGRCGLGAIEHRSEAEQLLEGIQVALRREYGVSPDPEVTQE